MTKRTSVLMGGMAAAVALTAMAGGANATTTPLYAGGSTLVEKVYRDTFNAYGSTASGELCLGLTTVCPTTHYNSGIEILYVGVGSGNGLKALETNNPLNYVSGPKTPDSTPIASTTDFGPYYGSNSGTGSSFVWTVDTTGAGPAYPKVSFSGSDNTLGSSDITAAAASPLGNNPLIQVPGIVAAIAVPFQPAAHWLPKGVAATGGSSKVQLSTNTLCGIFTGKITLWNSPAITKDNGGVRLGTGPITVVYRHDSSGTTFLFSNALVNQCGVTAATGITAFSTKSTYPVPGQWLVDNESTPGTAPSYNANAPHYKTGTSFFINVFTAGHLPKNFINNTTLTNVTGGASGSGGVKAAILGTTGSIGYVSPDFVQPVDKTGPEAANLQTYASFSAGTTAVYKAPTATNAIPIMSSSKPPTFPTAAANPLNWGAIDPLPTSTAAYPIGGFSFIDLHRCYASATDVAALAGTTAGQLGYLTWYFGANSVNGGKPAAILKQDGFAQVPTAWALSAIRLLTAPLTGVNVVGTGSCKTVKHGA